MRFGWVHSVSLILALASPLDALAQTDVARAQALNREGASAYRAEQYELALEKFKGANALVPNSTFDVNIGRCHEALGRFAQALVHCKVALNASTAIAATRAKAKECVERLNARLTQPDLHVRSRPMGATLRIDGRAVGTTPWTGAVEPGRRQLDLELAGHRPQTSYVVMVLGVDERVSIALLPADVGALLSLSSVPTGAAVALDGEFVGQTPLERIPVEAKSYLVEVAKEGFLSQILTISIGDGSHLERSVALRLADPTAGEPTASWPGWTMLGVGVAAAAVGTFFGIKAYDVHQKADRLARTSGLPEDRPNYESLLIDLDQYRTTADVGWSIGVVGLVGGIAWFSFGD